MYHIYIFFFFKQKTAYEMRISDWSSDVCSSDLQAHQQLKEELGLDHFEGRSWVGLHRHALMTMIAYAFLQARRLKAAGRKKKSRGAAATTEHASYPTGDLEHLHKASATSVPPL